MQQTSECVGKLNVTDIFSRPTLELCKFLGKVLFIVAVAIDLGFATAGKLTSAILCQLAVVIGANPPVSSPILALDRYQL